MIKWIQALAFMAIPILLIILVVVAAEYMIPRFPGWLRGLLFWSAVAYGIFAVSKWLVERQVRVARIVIATVVVVFSIATVITLGYYFVPVPSYGITLNECANIIVTYFDTLETDTIQAISWDQWPSDSDINGEDAKQFMILLVMAHTLGMDFDKFLDKTNRCNRMIEDFNDR